MEAFELIKDPVSHLYINENISLLITGVGKAKTGDRIQTLLKHDKDFGETVVFNIGIAGGNRRETNVGELYWVNSIHDEDSGQTFFPDILLRHQLKEKSLTTVSKGVTKNGDRYAGLVDMEGSAIFRLMSKKVPPHRLVFLKVVSDYMDVTDWKTLDLAGLIKNQVDLIQSIMADFGNEFLSDRMILNQEEMEMVNGGAEKLMLTETQRIQLVDWSENYKKRTANKLGGLNSYLNRESKSKQERNKIFDEIRQFLSA